MSKDYIRKFLRYVRLWFKIWTDTSPPRQHIEICLAEIGKIRANLLRKLKETE